MEQQGLDLFTQRSNNDSFYSVQGLIAQLHPQLIWPCETSTPSGPTAIHQFHWNSKTPVLSCIPVGTVSARVGKTLTAVFLRNTSGYQDRRCLCLFWCIGTTTLLEESTGNPFILFTPPNIWKSAQKTLLIPKFS